MTTLGLYLSSEPDCGGTYTYNRLIYEAALSTGYDICAITEHQHWVDRFQEDGIHYKKVSPSIFWVKLASLFRYMHLPLVGYRTLAKWGYPLARTMISMKADYWVFPSQDALSYLMPVPSIGVIHDLMHRYEAQFEEVGNARVVKSRDYLYSRMVHYSKAVFVDSKIGKTHVQETYEAPEQKVLVLPFCALPRSGVLTEVKFFQKYPIPKKYVFYPAQFWSHKNHLRLVEASKEIIKNYPDFTLVLVGAPKNAYEKVLEKVTEAKLEKHVLFLGFVPEEDIPSFYHYARALVMPTFFGPTNIPPLESHLYDCPVIISGIYAMKEQLEDAAFYVDPKSTISIKGALEKIWTDDELCKRLISKGHLLKKKHSQDTFNLTFKRLFEKLINQSEQSSNSRVSKIPSTYTDEPTEM